VRQYKGWSSLAQVNIRVSRAAAIIVGLGQAGRRLLVRRGDRGQIQLGVAARNSAERTSPAGGATAISTERMNQPINADLEPRVEISRGVDL
jgi:hypothetical protein